MSGLSRRAAIGLVTAGLATATASSDEILLRSGGRVSGVVVERTPSAIVVETGPGRVTLSMALVEKVVEGRSALEAYHERAAALEPGDVEGWAALARWAAERDLVTQSREAWQRVLSADPSHREANAALGRVEVDGTWMGEAEAYRARGYVSFEGRWVTPARARGPGARACGRGGLGARGPRGRAARPGGRGARPGGGSAGPGGRGRGAAGGRRHPLRVGLGRRWLRPGRRPWARTGIAPGRPNPQPSGADRDRPADRPSERSRRGPPIGRPPRSRRRNPSRRRPGPPASNPPPREPAAPGLTFA